MSKSKAIQPIPLKSLFCPGCLGKTNSFRTKADYCTLKNIHGIVLSLACKYGPNLLRGHNLRIQDGNALVMQISIFATWQNCCTTADMPFTMKWPAVRSSSTQVLRMHQVLSKETSAWRRTRRGAIEWTSECTPYGSTGARFEWPPRSAPPPTRPCRSPIQRRPVQLAPLKLSRSRHIFGNWCSLVSDF